MSATRAMYRKLVGTLLLFAAFASFAAPRPAVAETDCTDSYEGCLVSAYKKSGVMRELAYVECFAKWTGCVAKEVLLA